MRDLVLPPQCQGCSCVVETPDTLCAKCWSALSLIGPAVCHNCGVPFPYDQYAPLCAPCAGHTPPFGRARAAVVYDEGCRAMILGFKYSDRTEAAALFARLMITAFVNLIDDADVLIPVPLDRKRLFHRRYNQAALLAQAINKQHGVRVLPDAMERIKPTPGQGTLLGKIQGKKNKISAAERRRSVQGAFRVRDDYVDQLAGRRVLVIDDVYTTGATAWAMARVLNRAGVEAVDVLTFARVVRN
ncbi:MAG: ComF family protein [Rhodospirillales bacterium]|nr:ComF family protein [Rhodospirillales bacterium]